MMGKDMKNMADVMDHLILERKEAPVYTQDLYKWTWTPQPTILKQDIKWKIPIAEKVECPYCREDNAIDIINDEEIFIYVDPEGYLRFGESHGIGKVDIQFCPMCGKRL